jgi:hypothetical protein
MRLSRHARIALWCLLHLLLWRHQLHLLLYLHLLHLLLHLLLQLLLVLLLDWTIALQQLLRLHLRLAGVLLWYVGSLIHWLIVCAAAAAASAATLRHCICQ